MNDSLPSFKSPPLEEVSIGVQFETLHRLKIPHFGAFWESLKKDFPAVEHAAPIPDKKQELLIDPNSGMPIPRVWLINHSDTRLIQLQPNRYNFNWRRRGDSDVYPRHPEIAANFFNYFERLEKFALDADIGIIKPTVVELSYVNILVRGNEWNTMSDLNRIFRDFSWTDQGSRFLPHPVAISWAAAFDIPNDQGSIRVKLNRAKRTTNEEPILHFEIAASRPADGMSLDDMRSWYKLAHEWIVRAFVDLTTTEVQTKYWGLEK